MGGRVPPARLGQKGRARYQDGALPRLRKPTKVCGGVLGLRVTINSVQQQVEQFIPGYCDVWQQFHCCGRYVQRALAAVKSPIG